MKHKTPDKLCAQAGCKICCAYYLAKYYDSRLTDIERMRLEEVVGGK